MAQSESEIERRIVAEIGRGEAQLLKKNAGSRLAGVLHRRGSDWDKAFEHIREHFGPSPGKTTHSVFVARYRDEESMRRLLLDVASGPSRIRWTKLTVHGDHLGTPAVEIQRDFARVVGERTDSACPERAATPLTRVRVFLDRHGRLITAYPDATG